MDKIAALHARMRAAKQAASPNATGGSKTGHGKREASEKKNGDTDGTWPRIGAKVALSLGRHGIIPVHKQIVEPDARHNPHSPAGGDGAGTSKGTKWYQNSLSSGSFCASARSFSKKSTFAVSVDSLPQDIVEARRTIAHAAVRKGWKDQACDAAARLASDLAAERGVVGDAIGTAGEQAATATLAERLQLAGCTTQVSWITYIQNAAEQQIESDATIAATLFSTSMDNLRRVLASLSTVGGAVSKLLGTSREQTRTELVSRTASMLLKSSAGNDTPALGHDVTRRANATADAEDIVVQVAELVASGTRHATRLVIRVRAVEVVRLLSAALMIKRSSWATHCLAATTLSVVMVQHLAPVQDDVLLSLHAVVPPPTVASTVDPSQLSELVNVAFVALGAAAHRALERGAGPRSAVEEALATALVPICASKHLMTALGSVVSDASEWRPIVSAPMLLVRSSFPPARRAALQALCMMCNERSSDMSRVLSGTSNPGSSDSFRPFAALLTRRSRYTQAELLYFAHIANTLCVDRKQAAVGVHGLKKLLNKPVVANSEVTIRALLRLVYLLLGEQAGATVCDEESQLAYELSRVKELDGSHRDAAGLAATGLTVRQHLESPHRTVLPLQQQDACAWNVVRAVNWAGLALCDSLEALWSTVHAVRPRDTGLWLHECLAMLHVATNVPADSVRASAYGLACSLMWPFYQSDTIADGEDMEGRMQLVTAWTNANLMDPIMSALRSAVDTPTTTRHATAMLAALAFAAADVDGQVDCPRGMSAEPYSKEVQAARGLRKQMWRHGCGDFLVQVVRKGFGAAWRSLDFMASRSNSYSNLRAAAQCDCPLDQWAEAVDFHVAIVEANENRIDLVNALCALAAMFGSASQANEARFIKRGAVGLVSSMLRLGDLETLCVAGVMAWQLAASPRIAWEMARDKTIVVVLGWLHAMSAALLLACGLDLDDEVVDYFVVSSSVSATSVAVSEGDSDDVRTPAPGSSADHSTPSSKREHRSRQIDTLRNRLEQDSSSVQSFLRAISTLSAAAWRLVCAHKGTGDLVDSHGGLHALHCTVASLCAVFRTSNSSRRPPHASRKPIPVMHSLLAVQRQMWRPLYNCTGAIWAMAQRGESRSTILRLDTPALLLDLASVHRCPEQLVGLAAGVACDLLRDLVHGDKTDNSQRTRAGAATTETGEVQLARALNVMLHSDSEETRSSGCLLVAAGPLTRTDQGLQALTDCGCVEAVMNVLQCAERGIVATESVVSVRALHALLNCSATPACAAVFGQPQNAPTVELLTELAMGYGLESEHALASRIIANIGAIGGATSRTAMYKAHLAIQGREMSAIYEAERTITRSTRSPGQQQQHRIESFPTDEGVRGRFEAWLRSLPNPREHRRGGNNLDTVRTQAQACRADATISESSLLEVPSVISEPDATFGAGVTAGDVFSRLSRRDGVPPQIPLSKLLLRGKGLSSELDQEEARERAIATTVATLEKKSGADGSISRPATVTPTHHDRVGAKRSARTARRRPRSASTRIVKSKTQSRSKAIMAQTLKVGLHGPHKRPQSAHGRAQPSRRWSKGKTMQQRMSRSQTIPSLHETRAQIDVLTSQDTETLGTTTPNSALASSIVRRVRNGLNKSGHLHVVADAMDDGSSKSTDDVWASTRAVELGSSASLHSAAATKQKKPDAKLLDSGGTSWNPSIATYVEIVPDVLHPDVQMQGTHIKLSQEEKRAKRIKRARRDAIARVKPSVVVLSERTDRHRVTFTEKPRWWIDDAIAEAVKTPRTDPDDAPTGVGLILTRPPHQRSGSQVASRQLEKKPPVSASERRERVNQALLRSRGRTANGNLEGSFRSPVVPPQTTESRRWKIRRERIEQMKRAIVAAAPPSRPAWVVSRATVKVGRWMHVSGSRVCACQGCDVDHRAAPGGSHCHFHVSDRLFSLHPDGALPPPAPPTTPKSALFHYERGYGALPLKLRRLRTPGDADELATRRWTPAGPDRTTLGKLLYRHGLPVVPHSCGLGAGGCQHVGEVEGTGQILLKGAVGPPTAHDLDRIAQLARRAADRAERKAAAERERLEQERNKWSLERSVWIQRKRESAAQSFFDTPVVQHKAFEVDWARTIEKRSVQDLIRERGGGEEILQVKNVMEKYYSLLSDAFEYFAARSLSVGDAAAINYMMYFQFLEECSIVDEESLGVRRQHCEIIFTIVNQEEDGTSKEGVANLDRALMRFELLEAIVRLGVAKYFDDGVTSDVSDSITMVCERNITPALEPKHMLFDSNTFRRDRLYHEAVDKVLRRHSRVLRAVHKHFSQPKKTVPLKYGARLSLKEFSKALAKASMFDDDFTRGEVSLAFSYSRMGVVDELIQQGLWTSLSFTDFLEALARVAEMISLPTVQEMKKAGAENAYEFALGHSAKRRASSEWNVPSTRPLAEKLGRFLELFLGRLDRTGAGHLTVKKIGQW